MSAGAQDALSNAEPESSESHPADWELYVVQAYESFYQLARPATESPFGDLLMAADSGLQALLNLDISLVGHGAHVAPRAAIDAALPFSESERQVLLREMQLSAWAVESKQGLEFYQLKARWMDWLRQSAGRYPTDQLLDLLTSLAILKQESGRKIQ
jgi:hypothetical protein